MCNCITNPSFTPTNRVGVGVHAGCGCWNRMLSGIMGIKSLNGAVANAIRSTREARLVMRFRHGYDER